MNDPAMRKLLKIVHRLNSARRVRNYVKISECYERLTVIVGDIYATRDVTTALAVENALIAGEQNGINKTSATHKAISEHLARIGKAQEADFSQLKNPKKYHFAAFLDHADKHCKDGTADDAVRVALAEGRKRAKYLITAMGAEDNVPKRQCNILRHSGLFDSERTYIERQIECQETYDSPDDMNAAKEEALKSFDMKMRRELRDLAMSPEPEWE